MFLVDPQLDFYNILFIRSFIHSFIFIRIHFWTQLSVLSTTSILIEFYVCRKCLPLTFRYFSHRVSSSPLTLVRPRMCSNTSCKLLPHSTLALDNVDDESRYTNEYIEKFVTSLLWNLQIKNDTVVNKIHNIQIICAPHCKQKTLLPSK